MWLLGCSGCQNVDIQLHSIKFKCSIFLHVVTRMFLGCSELLPACWYVVARVLLGFSGWLPECWYLIKFKFICLVFFTCSYQTVCKVVWGVAGVLLCCSSYANIVWPRGQPYSFGQRDPPLYTVLFKYKYCMISHHSLMSKDKYTTVSNTPILMLEIMPAD